jgi:hypothetical protein
MIQPVGRSDADGLGGLPGMMRAGIAASSFLAGLLLGCGGTSTTTPASPTPSPTASPNQAPQIVSATVTPSAGIVGLTTFAAHVDARDPDGDPLSISWSDGARRLVGQTADLTFQAGHDVVAPLTVTVTDSKGVTATAKADFLAGDINCHTYCEGFFGPEQNLDRFYLYLISTSTRVTGTIKDSRTYEVGSTDPAEPGSIDAAGRFRVRFNFPLYGGDFVFEGQLAPSKPLEPFLTNYMFTGRVIGGRLDGHTVTFGEHSPY